MIFAADEECPVFSENSRKPCRLPVRMLSLLFLKTMGLHLLMKSFLVFPLQRQRFLEVVARRGKAGCNFYRRLEVGDALIDPAPAHQRHADIGVDFRILGLNPERF
jgi:hypothetical protein